MNSAQSDLINAVRTLATSGDRLQQRLENALAKLSFDANKNHNTSDATATELRLLLEQVKDEGGAANLSDGDCRDIINRLIGML